jgi:SAM-dependent MidA family methyltransferase
MFHPKFGYYGSGRVSFSADYQTFPIVLAPYFGHMIAEHIFKMWRGMRAARTLAANEKFTIAEFGAGNGVLAESILDYLEQHGKSAEAPDGWRDFAAQTVYACYDRSPALSKAQRQRNARFGSRFEAREGDATEPQAAIPAGSLKGVVLSNELPDAFSVHKVILSAAGDAEVAFVAPSIPRDRWQAVRKGVPDSVAKLVDTGDRSVTERLLNGKSGPVYFTRESFTALLEALAPSREYDSTVQAFQFQEIYVPAVDLPDLGSHFRRYARVYSLELARQERGVVTYVNLGSEKFIQGAAKILKAGYVITLDYGSNWQGLIAQDSHPHLRTYGPAHVEQIQSGDADGQSGDYDTSDPYRGPTLNDMTTDVNFSLLSAEGRLAGLKTLYFGAHKALRHGTAVSLATPPPDRQSDAGLYDEFLSWADKFETDANYKLMVQQKEGSDPSYVFPGKDPEPLESDENGFSEAQRKKAAAIEKRLSAGRS